MRRSSSTWVMAFLLCQRELDEARPRVEKLLNGRIYLRPVFARDEPRSDIWSRDK
jgi:hypothetical protein